MRECPECRTPFLFLPLQRDEVRCLACGWYRSGLDIVRGRLPEVGPW
jgi:hypothetical protein